MSPQPKYWGGCVPGGVDASASHPKSVLVISMFFVLAASSVSERYAFLTACLVAVCYSYGVMCYRDK